MGVVVAAGILGAALIFCVIWVGRELNSRSERENGKQVLSVEEVESLVRSLGETLTLGIRTALGLDLAAEVIAPEEELELPGYIHDLEMDPFMRELEDFPLPEGTDGQS